MHILIVTVADDLHSQAVAHELESRAGCQCRILELDHIAEHTALSWKADDEHMQLSLRGGEKLDIGEVDVIWWRRTRATQEAAARATLSPSARSLIENDCAAATIGALLTCFRGAWVSDPMATTRAANKLLQLSAARKQGLSVPRTLVSNDPAEVLAFLDGLPGRAIVKPVVGSKDVLAYTQFVSRSTLTQADLDSISWSPAIFQEFVPGETHIRLNMFGEDSYAARIDSQALDWRPDLRVPVAMTTLPDEVLTANRRLLDDLNLRMGVIDMKRTPAGEYLWLEVNPQGQFLFLEGLTGVPMTRVFADFLIASAGCPRAELATA